MTVYSGSVRSARHARGYWSRLGSALGEIYAGIASARSAAVALSLILAGLMAAPAQAQTEETLVSNTGKTTESLQVEVANVSSAARRPIAQGFTTGSAVGGYTLSKVVVKMGNVLSGAEVQVSIYTANESGNPGTSVYTLTNPASFIAGSNTFTAPSNSTLDEETDYFVVFENGSTQLSHKYFLRATADTGEDDGAASGWSISNGRIKKFDDWTAVNDPVQIAIIGTADNPRRTYIWTATLTAAELRRLSDNSLIGYGFHPRGGTLSDATFTYNSVDYTVLRLYDTETNALLFRLSPNGGNVFNKGQFKLHIGSTDYSFGDATYDVFSEIFSWDQTLNWSAGDEFAVGISSNPPNATGVPTISGTANFGETLTASTTDIMDPDGLTNATYTYQWIRVDADGTSNPMDIPDGTSSMYTLVHADTGKRLKVRVRFTDDDGVEEELTSAASEVVQGPPGPPRNLQALARAGRQIVLSWDAPAENGGREITGYSIEVSTDGATFAILEANHDATQYVHDTGLSIGRTVYYRVSAINSLGKGTRSNTASAITVDPMVVLSLSSLNLEEGGSATYTVVLNGQPSSTVQVTYVSDNPDVTVSPRTLTFTTANWEVAQEVTVSAEQDADDVHEEATVTHSESGSYYQSSSVRVAVSDDENPSIGTLGAEFYYIYHLGAIPGVHFGESFEVRVRLTDSLSWTDLTSLVGPDRGIRVTGGTVTSIEVMDTQSHSRRILVFQIQPSGGGDVTLTLEPLPCDASGAVCTSEANGLAERVRHTVRGAGVPPVPTGLQVERETRRLRVSVVGTDEANISRVQWKRPGQEWSEAEEFWRYRSAGPEDRHSCVDARVHQHESYEVRVRWESPVGEGPWAYGTRVDPVPDSSLQLTAEFRNMPATHNGSTAFIFELRFSENWASGLSYVTLRDHAFTVTNGEVTDARRRIRGKNQRWEITVEPAGNADVTITLPATTDCGATGAICIFDRPLSAAVSATVRGPTGPLTAEFRNMPTTHNGSAAFNFELRFSEDVPDLSYVTLRDHAFTVTNGEVTGARRLVQKKNQRWEITVEPAGNDAVTITLPATTDCGATGAICNGTRPLSAAVTATVPGPGSGKLLALADGPLLLQNAPNPFNSQTVISWFLLKPGPTRLEVFTLTGQRVEVLHQGPQQAGLHRLHWEGRDEQGRPLASGIYIYRLATAEGVLTQKLILLR